MKCPAGLALTTAPLLSTPQGEPGADGEAGKEVPLCWAPPFLLGMLLLALSFALTPLHSFSKCSLYAQTISGQIYRKPVPLFFWGEGLGTRGKG